nr:hypothetical protein [Butyrivibrio sp.]
VKENPELASVGITVTDTLKTDDILICEKDLNNSSEKNMYKGFFENNESKKIFLVSRKSNGTIRGLHYGEDDGEPNAPKSADIINPAAVNKFIELTHEQYYKYLKQYFGNTIIAFFTDEPSILGRNVDNMLPWTYGFLDEFVLEGGNPKDLFYLFKKNMYVVKSELNDILSISLYNQMILDKESNIYFRRLSEWCQEHGISLMGHPHQSDDIEVEKWFHIPGQDLVFRWVSPETGDTTGMDSCMGHCSADAALIMNRRRNANEVFGACNRNGNDWYFTADDFKWFIDYLAVRGVNMFVPHAFYYSLDGKRSGERPPDVGPGSIWWKYYEHFSLYMKRLSALMTDIIPLDSVAVICENRKLYTEMVKPLIENQIGFHYIPKSFLNDITIKKNKNGNSFFSIGNMKYDRVVAEDSILPEIKHILLKKNENDLYVISDLEKQNIHLTNSDISDYKDASVPISEDCQELFKDIRSTNFIKNDTLCWYIVNAGEKDIFCNAYLSPITDVPETNLINHRQNKCYSNDAVKKYYAVYDIWNNTEYRFDNKLSLRRRDSVLIYECSKEQYDSLSEYSEPYIIKTDFVQDGERQINSISYSCIIDIRKNDIENDNLQIKIDADEMAELFINGEFAGVSFYSPHYFDIKKFVKEGNNALTLKVTGSLANVYGHEKVFFGIKEK